MNKDLIKKAVVLGISLGLVLIAFIPAVSQVGTSSTMSYGDGDTSSWSSDDTIVNLGVPRWLLLGGTAIVTAYANNNYGILTHRGTRGLGVKGGEQDEIDSIGRFERIEVTFENPRCLIFFEVRSLFKETYGGSPVTEEGDIDLYYNGSLVAHYHVVAEENIGMGNGVVNTSGINDTIDRAVFYINKSEPYAMYSEFAVAKLGFSNGYISFVVPLSGVDNFRAMDVDDDSNCEYAVDADYNGTTGYELFKDYDDSSTATSSIDGDNDGKIDHFIDVDSDDIPERYWDPDDDLLSDLYTLTIHFEGSGSVIKNPDNLVYFPSTIVELTAVADPGWTFDHWSGNLSGNDNPETVNMTGDKNVTAHFTEDYYVLTVTTVGNGSVSVDPAGPYTYGTLVTLTAIPNLGWIFSHWSGNLSGNDNPETVNMTGDKEVTAVFTEEEYTITITIEGNGTVAKYPDQSTYTYGTSVELTAIASLGWTFDHWSGNLTGNDNPISIIMDGNKTVTAHFTEHRYILTVTIDGEGSVIKNPDQQTYTYGTLVELTAIADFGWTFDHWSGNLSGNDNPETVNMTGNKTVTAHFTEDYYVLTVTTVGNGSVSVDPAGPYTYGTLVTLTAIPNLGWTFSHWSGNLSGNDNPETINMTGDKEVTATFTEEEYTLTITIEGNGTVAKYPDQSTYTYGTSVELTATASLGWTFDHWSGNLTGNDNPISIIMDGNKTVTAHFTEHRYILTVTIDGEGSVIKNPDQQTYTYGTLVELTAVADFGWTFDHWSGNLSGNDNPETVNMTGNKTVTAHFAEEEDNIPPTIEIVQPRNAIYIFNWKILPFPFPIIMRGVTIEVNTSDNKSGVERVEFYIDGELRAMILQPPYTWTWIGDTPRKHTITATAYDYAGNNASQEITVWKWKFHPGLVALLVLLAFLKARGRYSQSG